MSSEPPVILKLESGLGNQLSQFAAGFYLVAKLRSDLKIDQYSIPLSTFHGERRLGFEEFVWPQHPENKSIKVQKSILGTFTTKLAVGNGTVKKILLKLRMYSSNLRFLPTFYETREILDFLSLSEPKKGHGNFQSWKIVEVAAAYGFPRSLELKNPSSWIGEQLSQNEMSNVFVFSYDIEIAKDRFGEILGGGVHFIRQPDSATPAERLLHLSRFENIICANSAFCGWAGWTIGNVSGQVMVPVPYSGSQALGSRGFPREWIKLSKISGAAIG